MTMIATKTKQALEPTTYLHFYRGMIVEWSTDIWLIVSLVCRAEKTNIEVKDDPFIIP